LCAPENQADDAGSLMLCMVVLNPTVYVNYLETQFVTIRQVSDLSEPPSVAQFTSRKRVNYVETLFYLATVNSHCPIILYNLHKLDMQCMCE